MPGATQPLSVSSSLVNSPCTSQAACTGHVPHCVGCFLSHFLILSSVPLNTSVKQDLVCKAGSRILSILQVRRDSERCSHLPKDTQQVQWLPSHALSYTPCCIT